MQQNIGFEKNYWQEGSDSKQLIYLIFATLILIISWYIPNGKLVFYPLSLLATWFHEGGHALMAWILGVKVSGFQIMTNLSGATNLAIPVGYSPVKHALIVASGPIAPAIIGSLMIMSGRNPIATRIALWMIVGLITITCIFFATQSVGIAIIGLIGLSLGYALVKFEDDVLRVIVHIIGVQGVISIFSTYAYLARNSSTFNGKKIVSDSQLIATLIGHSQMFWALIFTGISIIMMIAGLLVSFGYIFRSR